MIENKFRNQRNDFVNKQSNRIKNMLLKSYHDGNILSLLNGDDDDKFNVMIEQVVQNCSCYEQGSSAELARLKDWIGCSLPSDWEASMFQRHIKGNL